MKSNTTAWSGGVRITSKGQVTIPVAVRRRLGLLPNTEVEIVLEGGKAVLRKATKRSGRGAAIVARLRGSGVSNGLTTDEILSLMRDG